MTIQEVAEFVRLPVQTLYSYRTRGGGPKASRLGRHLRYRREDVERWIDAQASDRDQA